MPSNPGPATASNIQVVPSKYHMSYILESALEYNTHLDAQQKKEDLGIHSRMSQSNIEKLFTLYINYDRIILEQK
jgi:hypothetical protein